MLTRSQTSSVTSGRVLRMSVLLASEIGSVSLTPVAIELKPVVIELERTFAQDILPAASLMALMIASNIVSDTCFIVLANASEMVADASTLLFTTGPLTAAATIAKFAVEPSRSYFETTLQRNVYWVSSNQEAASVYT